MPSGQHFERMSQQIVDPSLQSIVRKISAATIVTRRVSKEVETLIPVPADAAGYEKRATLDGYLPHDAMQGRLVLCPA